VTARRRLGGVGVQAQVLDAELAWISPPRHLPAPLTTRQAEPSAALLVSADPFDIIAASAAGLRTVWCKRATSALFDPWGRLPATCSPALPASRASSRPAGRPPEPDGRW